MMVYPTFHVSLLCPFRGDSHPLRTSPAPPPVIIDDQEEQEITEIKAARVSGKLQYLLQWERCINASDMGRCCECTCGYKLEDFHHSNPRFPGPLSGSLFILPGQSSLPSIPTAKSPFENTVRNSSRRGQSVTLSFLLCLDRPEDSPPYMSCSVHSQATSLSHNIAFFSLVYSHSCVQSSSVFLSYDNFNFFP